MQKNRYYISEKTRKDYRVNDRQQGGYRNQGSSSTTAPRRGKLSHNILPPPGVLEAYDELVEGSASQLFTMAEKEQRHRHDWENKYLTSHVRSYRVGQLLGFLTAVSVVTGATILASKGDSTTAQVLAVSGFVFLTLTTFLSAKGRRFARRPGGKEHQHGNRPAYGRDSYENRNRYEDNEDEVNGNA